MKLSGAVQRKIGLKALELGGNAVVGYEYLNQIDVITNVIIIE